MHRISDFRVGGISRRNFSMFRKLCGDDALSNVVVVTTMWNEVSAERGAAREHELRNSDILFKPALEKGATMLRHDNTQASARAILRHLMDNRPKVLRIQKEIVDEGKDITDTAAGIELNCHLEAMSRKHLAELAGIRREMQALLAESRREMQATLAAREIETKRELEQTRTDLLKSVEDIERDRRKLSRDFAEERDKMEAKLREARQAFEAERAAHEESRKEIARLKEENQRHRSKLDDEARGMHQESASQPGGGFFMAGGKQRGPGLFSIIGGIIDHIFSY